MSKKLEQLSIEKAENMGRQMMADQQMQQLTADLKKSQKFIEETATYIAELEKEVPKKKLAKIQAARNGK